MSVSLPDPVFKKLITVSASVIDGNGHVSNVAYVQWMQDIAVEHYASIHGVEAQAARAEERLLIADFIGSDLQHEVLDHHLLDLPIECPVRFHH